MGADVKERVTQQPVSIAVSTCVHLCHHREERTYVNKGLLHLPVRRHRGAGVLLPPHPGADRLQRAVRTSPARVIKSILHKHQGHIIGRVAFMSWSRCPCLLAERHAAVVR